MNNEAFFNVIIIGGGTGGMGAAYALKDKGLRVAVVEQQKTLGGTACNAWVDTWAYSLVPSYIQTIYTELSDKVKSGDLDNTWLRRDFSAKGTTGGIWMDKDALSEKYAKDLEGKVTVLTGHRFIKVDKRDGNRVVNVELLSESGNKLTLWADFFIDASADGALCRSVNSRDGVDFYWGRDAKATYNESIASVNVSPYREYLNEPSLFFEIRRGYDDSALLNACTTVYADYNSDGTIRQIHQPGYLCLDGYCSDNGIVNPMTSLGSGKIGSEVLKKGIDAYYVEYKKRVVEYWKLLKLSLQQKKEQGGTGIGAWSIGHQSWGYTGKCAFYLGVRETYRIHCEYMLNQNDLTHLINSRNLKHHIASSSHSVDFHIPNGLNLDEMDKLNGSYVENKFPQLRPYGIPYECLVPCKLDNVLIASRCYGASQIALASARLNMLIAQIGWAAGNAIRLCLDEKLQNVREVCTEFYMAKLQSDDYTEFESRVKIQESKYNERLKKELNLCKL